MVTIQHGVARRGSFSCHSSFWCQTQPNHNTPPQNSTATVSAPARDDDGNGGSRINASGSPPSPRKSPAFLGGGGEALETPASPRTGSDLFGNIASDDTVALELADKEPSVNSSNDTGLRCVRECVLMPLVYVNVEPAKIGQSK